MAASIKQKAWLNQSGTGAATIVVGSGQGLIAAVTGNTIVVQVLTLDTTTTVTVTDSAANTYVLDSGPEKICQAGGILDTAYRRVFHASNITGTPTSVTATQSTAAKSYMAVYELAAIRTTSPLDAHVFTAARINSTSNVPAEQIAFTTTFADEVALACFSSDGVGTITPGSGWTIDFNDSGSIVFMSQVLTTSGSFTASVSTTASNNSWDFGVDTYMGLGSAPVSANRIVMLN